MSHGERAELRSKKLKDLWKPGKMAGHSVTASNKRVDRRHKRHTENQRVKRKAETTETA
jgi:hypothetical protein